MERETPTAVATVSGWTEVGPTSDAPGAPGSVQVSIDAVAAGATTIRNATRAGSEGTDISVYDPRTGEPLKFTYEEQPNGDHAIVAQLPQAIPQGGIGRVLIYKTYKDERTYQVNGDNIVWVRSLSGYRLGVVLPKGYAFTSSNIAAQMSTTADGRVRALDLAAFPVTWDVREHVLTRPVVAEDGAILEPHVVERIDRDQLHVVGGLLPAEREQIVDQPRRRDDGRPRVEREAILLPDICPPARLVALLEHGDLVPLRTKTNGRCQSAKPTADDENSHMRLNADSGGKVLHAKGGTRTHTPF